MRKRALPEGQPRSRVGHGDCGCGRRNRSWLSQAVGTFRPMATTSADLIAAKVSETRSALLRNADAIDSKAGVLLGFAGAFVILSFSDFSRWRLPGIAFATASAFACLNVFTAWSSA